MDINCIICSDLFNHNSEIVLNQCGHMFHYSCLVQWIERSKTCPQCRCRATEKSLYRVFFNFANTENIKDDVATLQFKLDNATFKISSIEKKLREQTEHADSKEAQNIQLKELVSTLEKKIRSYDSMINGLKEKLSYYKNRASEAERLQSEVASLKTALDNVEKVQTAIHGTLTEVDTLVRNETHIEVVATLSVTLKKSLIAEQRKCSSLHKQLKLAQNELMKYKRDCNSLDFTLADVRKEFDSAKKSWEEEKKYLKVKVEELVKKMEEQMSGTPEINKSVHRILTESPAPLPRRRIDLLKADKPAAKASPTVAENVMQILDSDSPYLNTKTNYSSIFSARYSTPLNRKKSIFKPWVETSEATSNSSNVETVYTGLGGQVKQDFFKFPEKKPQTGLKRAKSSSAVPTTKFRKLAPLSSRKITDFTK